MLFNAYHRIRTGVTFVSSIPASYWLFLRQVTRTINLSGERKSLKDAVDGRTMPFNPQTIAIFLRTLRNKSVFFFRI